MKIKKIEWKNIASYGNKIQSIELPELPGLIQVIGENGAGKSTISDVIIFALYGRLDGKKLKDISNRFNGSGWVRIIFEENNNLYEIRRNLEPSSFEFFINNKLYDRAGKKNVQDTIENILKIPYYVFNNTISLSINDFKSFLKMNPTDKRLIIDKIFGFYILNEMRNILKEENKNVRSILDKISGEIIGIEKSILTSQKELEELQKKILKNTEKEKQLIEQEINNYKNLLNEHNKKIETFKTQEEKIQKESISFYDNFQIINNKIKDINTKIKLYENDKCPLCHSDLTTDYHKHILEQLLKQKEQLLKDIDIFKNKYENSKKTLEKLSSLKKELFIKKGNIETILNNNIKKLNEYTNNYNNEEINSLKNILYSSKEELLKYNKEKSLYEDKIKWIKIIDETLSERGIKQLAIKSILPSLNKEIFEILYSLRLPYKVVFDEEFNAQIYHFNEIISLNTLSTGEMKKIDFGVLIAIIKLMKIKFSSVNLLFLDEIFSSIDPEGIHTILNVLRKLCDELKMNIFVINHAPMPTELFDYKIEINKKNNFSELSFEKII